ncbi:hypothetical protein MKEN_00930400 [Mycena kentingensis (nom. inval.)]|nr:hypothetical protein MKEN_00930400 [Mycena kentingensis (nom. inval.)]
MTTQITFAVAQYLLQQVRVGDLSSLVLSDLKISGIPNRRSSRSAASLILCSATLSSSLPVFHVSIFTPILLSYSMLTSRAPNPQR